MNPNEKRIWLLSIKELESLEGNIMQWQLQGTAYTLVKATNIKNAYELKIGEQGSGIIAFWHRILFIYDQGMITIIGIADHF